MQKINSTYNINKSREFAMSIKDQRENGVAGLAFERSVRTRWEGAAKGGSCVRHLFRAAIAGVLALQLGVPTSAYADVQVRVSSFEYDAATGLLTKEIVEPEATVAGDPQALNRASFQLGTVYTYDAYGNKTVAATSSTATGVAAIASRSSNTGYAAGSASIGGTTYTWVAGQFPTTTTNALSQSETKLYDPRFGQVVGLTGPNGFTTQWAYDGFGRKTLELRADGTGTKYDYVYCTGSGLTIPTGAASGSCSAVPTVSGSITPIIYIQATPLSGLTTLTSAGTQSGARSKVYYDSLGREIRGETQGYDGSGSATSIYKDTQYDSLGRVYRVSRPYYAGGAVYWASTASYDAVGRILSQVDAAGVTTNFTYNGLTQVSTIVISGGNQTKTTVKNGQAQTVSVTDTNGKSVAYTYDAFGNLKTTTDALGNVSTLGYDIRGRKIQMNDPDMGQWTYGYNALGELVSQTDAKGQTTTMAYDLLGRLTQKSEGTGTPGGGMIANWYYDAYPAGADAGLITGFSCAKGVGKLCYTTADNGFKRAQSYDSLGRGDKTGTQIDGANYVSVTTFDTAGRAAAQQYPTGLKTKNIFTTLGYLKEVRRDNPGQGNDNFLYWSATAMDAEGRLTQFQYGNGVNSYQTYQATTGRLMLQEAGVGQGVGANVVNMAYTYDTVGNVLSRNDSARSVNETYTYDGLNRMSTVQIQGTGTGVSAGITTTAWTYNEIGNILTKNTTNGSTTISALTYIYNASGASSVRPHAVASITGGVNWDWEGGGGSVSNPVFSYDANGNLTGDTTARSVTWSAYNLPIQMSGGSRVANFVFDAEHQRIKQQSSGASNPNVTYYLDPANGQGLFYEKECLPDCSSGNRTIDRHFISAGGMTIGMILIDSVNGETTQYWHKDHLNSLVAMTKAASGGGYQICQTFRYDPFGGRQTMLDAGCDAIPKTERGFTGHEHIEELNFIHMNGRVFDPVLGRFLSPDPFVQDPGDLQSYNRYSYLYNNPLSGTDPTGYFSLRQFGRALGNFLLIPSPKNTFALLASQPGQQQIDNFIMSNQWAYAAGQIAAAYFGGPVGAAAFSSYYSYKATGSVNAAFKTGALSLATSLAFYEVGSATYCPGPSGCAFGSDMFIGNVVGHAAVGCVSAALGGGGCGAGALAAGVGAFATPLMNDWNPVAQFIGVTVVGGTASALGGGKFSNGAVTAAFGYLFNCVAHQSCPGSYNEKDPRFHRYGVYASARLCDASEEGCWASASYALHRYNGPLQSLDLAMDGTAVATLAGGNRITVTSMSPYMVSNVTESNHILRDGVVIRWAGVDMEGGVRIYTYGEGVNTNRLMKYANEYFLGPAMFHGRTADVPAINWLDAKWYQWNR